MKNKLIENLVLATDSYKLTHWKQYPSGTTNVFSYIESRGCDFSDRIMFFGLQYFLREYLSNPVTTKDVEQAAAFANKHGVPFNEEGWRYIVEEHDGYLPLKIKAAPEGTVMPVRNVMVTVETTDPNCYWLTSYMETALLRAVWYPSTVATNSFLCKEVIKKYLEETADDPEAELGFKLHDFGARGATSQEAAAIGGMAHIVNFMGTDTIAGVLAAMEGYDTDVCAFSIPATEHSTMTAWGKFNERDAYANAVEQYAGEGALFSVVSDSYDVYYATDMIWGEDLLEKVKEKGGTVVIRPDCYSEDTSLLTERGWVLFKNLKTTDKVAEVLDDGTYHFVKPIEYVEEYYEGDMYHFSDHHGKVDLFVTPEHRMVVDQNRKETIRFAKDMSDKGYHRQKMTRSAKANCGEKSELSDVERLKIAFQADGSYVTDSNSKIRFSFSKERKKERMIKIINRIGFYYSEYHLKDGRVEYHIDVGNSNEFLKDFSWVDTSTLNYKWCQDFIEELSYWDSHRRSNSRYKFDTTNKTVIEIVELIALSAGYGVFISSYNDERKDIFSKIYTANILLDNKVGGQSWKKTKTHYSGYVYCVKVPSGKIIVKRNKGTMVCGNSGDPTLVPINLMKRLMARIGYKVNSKGYKVLPDHVRFIQGDGIDRETMEEILYNMKRENLSASNITFGMGGGLLQKVDRDTFKFAMKCSAAEINGEWVDVYKDPVTDKGKHSKKGRLTLIKDGVGDYITMRYPLNLKPDTECGEVLRVVYQDGKLYNESTFEEVRERANEGLK